MRRFTLALTCLFIVVSGVCAAEERRVKIGFIASLSSFAANYGNAELEGARVAVEDLKAEGTIVDLIVEDDQSIAKNTVSAFIKLNAVDKVQALIGASWWSNSIVTQAERANIPLVSSEVLYNEDAVLGPGHFILQGDLRDWMRRFEPLIKDGGIKTGAIIRFSSGFSTTLTEEMKEMFSKDGRRFLGAVEYSDITVPDAAAVVLAVKKLDPEVIYIDAQPGGLANILKRMSEQGMTSKTILSHEIVADLLRDRLLDLSGFSKLYFIRRATFDPVFAARFVALHKKEPYLNADLGYYAVKLAVQALAHPDPRAALKGGLTVDGRRFTFNDDNVGSGIPQDIWKVSGKSAAKTEL